MLLQSRLEKTKEDYYIWCRLRRNMTLKKMVFVLGDKLSKIYDAAITLYEVAQVPKSTKM